MTQEQIADAAYSQKFSIARSMMYHERRVLFWEFLSGIAKFLEFATTSTAFVFIYAGTDRPLLQWVVLAAAIASFLAIILDAHKRIKHNTSQRARLGELALQIPHNLEALTEERLEEICTARKRIELDDGVILDCLNAICHNRQCDAEGIKTGLMHLNLWEATVGRFFPVPYKSKT